MNSRMERNTEAVNVFVIVQVPAKVAGFGEEML